MFSEERNMEELLQMVVNLEKQSKPTLQTRNKFSLFINNFLHVFFCNMCYNFWIALPKTVTWTWTCQEHIICPGPPVPGTLKIATGLHHCLSACFREKPVSWWASGSAPRARRCSPMLGHFMEYFCSWFLILQCHYFPESVAGLLVLAQLTSYQVNCIIT